MEKQKTPCQILIEKLESMQSDRSIPNDFEYGKEVMIEQFIDELKQLKANEERDMIVDIVDESQRTYFYVNYESSEDFYNQKYGEK